MKTLQIIVAILRGAILCVLLIVLVPTIYFFGGLYHIGRGESPFDALGDIARIYDKLLSKR